MPRDLLLSAGNAPSGSFLPEDYLHRKAERRSLFISVTLFTIVTFCVVAAFFVTNRQWTTVKNLQEDINRQYALEAQKIEELKVLEAQKAEMVQKAEVTAALIEKVPRSILLAELINRMPAQLTLTDLKLQGRRIVEAPAAIRTTPGQRPGAARPNSLAGAQTAAQIAQARPLPTRFEFKLELVGLSSTDTDVADYHAALLQCPLLERVELVSSGDVIIDNNLMRRFRIEANIRADADARHIEPLHVPRFHSRPLGSTVPNTKEPEPKRQPVVGAGDDRSRLR